MNTNVTIAKIIGEVTRINTCIRTNGPGEFDIGDLEVIEGWLKTQVTVSRNHRIAWHYMRSVIASRKALGLDIDNRGLSECLQDDFEDLLSRLNLISG
jgi:hypothetical protein